MPWCRLVNRVISDDVSWGPLVPAGGDRAGLGRIRIRRGVVGAGQQVDAELEERSVGDVEEVARAVVAGGELWVALLPAAGAGGAQQVPQGDQPGVLASCRQLGQSVDLGGRRGLGHGLGARAQWGGGIGGDWEPPQESCGLPAGPAAQFAAAGPVVDGVRNGQDRSFSGLAGATRTGGCGGCGRRWRGLRWPGAPGPCGHVLGRSGGGGLRDFGAVPLARVPNRGGLRRLGVGGVEGVVGVDPVSAAAQTLDGLAGAPGPVVAGGRQQVDTVQAVERLEAETGQVPLADVVGDSLGGGDVPVLGVRADDELAGQGAAPCGSAARDGCGGGRGGCGGNDRGGAQLWRRLRLSAGDRAGWLP